MNNLTTRKIVLGILMTLVLAFSVQGVAEAVQRPGEPSDLNPTTVYNVGGSATIASITLNFDDSTRRESVSISKSSGITFTGDFFGFTGGSLTENDSNGTNNNEGNRYAYTADGRQRFTTGTSITIGINFKTKGKHTVRISSTDYDDGLNDDEFSGSWSYTYTYYVKGPGTSTTTVSLRGLSNGYRQGLFTGTQIEVHSGDSGHYDVTYTTVPNTGVFQIEGTAGTLGSHDQANTASSAFDLLLTVSQTYQVTAKVDSSDITTTGTYIIGSPNLTVGSPDNPNGVGGAAGTGSKVSPGLINQVLPQAFRARVTDGTITTVPADVTGDATGAVPGVVVKFQVSGTGTASGYLVFDSEDTTNGRTVNSGMLVDANNREKLDANGSQLMTATAKVLYVRTNSSGQADVDFQLGTNRKQDVTISAVRQTKTVSAYTGTAISGNQLVNPSSQGSQALGRAGEFELRVKVVDEDGEALTGESVQFRTSDGTLDDPATAALPTTVGHVIVETDTRGEAFVFFDPKENSGSPRVTAHLLNVGTDGNAGTTDDTVIDDVVFNIGGGQQQNQQGPGIGTEFSVEPTILTGTAGSRRIITVTAPTGTTVQIDPNNTFGAVGGSASPAIGTGSTTSLITLPRENHTLLINAGGTQLSVPITVTSATGTLGLDVPVGGAPGEQLTVRVTATMTDGDPGAGVDVTLSTSGGVGTLSDSTVRTNPNGVATTTLTLGTVGSTGLVTARAPGYGEQELRVTVSSAAPTPAPTSGTRLVVSDGNNQTGEPGTRLSDPLAVTVVNNAGQAVPNQVVQFAVTRGGGRVSPSSATTNTSGQAQTQLTLGRTAGTNTVVASLNGVSVTFTARGELAPAYLEVYDGNNQRGTLNNELADPLVVQVLDNNEDGVADVRVDFRVTSGSARLSQRGTGNAVRVFTDRNGMAEAPLTPTGTGPITVQATSTGLVLVEFTITTGPPPASLTIVSGNNQAGTPDNALANPLVVEVQDADGGAVDGVMVTFEVTAGGGTLSAETATTNAQGRAQTSLTLGSEREINSVRASVTGLDPVTFNTSVDAVIHVAAANRPVMYWIDSGALYRLAGARATQIAARANDVAVDMASGKIYWVEGTSATTGRIHSANVDGTGATVVKELTSVPMGIALDSANGKLYLTNSWGKIQRMNVDGSQFETNLVVGLGNPMSIAVASGKVYWTDAAGSVRYANTTGTKVVRNIATGSGTLGGIAAGSNKVYWTEQTGNTTGRIRSANLDGSGIADLFALTAVPAGIAVDAGNVYWANGWGKVQRRNIDGSKFQDVVTGLMAPGAVATGGANVATPTPTPTPQPPTTAKSKYDVNGDGMVDNTDVGIVVAAMLSGNQQASLDVNGDGQVDLADVVAVSQNVDASGAAAAPALRTRLSSVQVDRIQEQIDLLLGMNDRSPGALYALQYLQSLLAVARPEKTLLLANYPNPFNPETWIPYELATDTNVKLTIYNAQGAVVRTLSLGHQSAGYYTGRDRAAYWDGRNSFGEQVASGLYFYQLETDETSLMRKMVILK